MLITNIGKFISLQKTKDSTLLKYYYEIFNLQFLFSSSMLQTIKMIYKENGIIKGLYRGMSINYLRAIPMVSVSFTTYEIMKQILQLDTGIKL